MTAAKMIVHPVRTQERCQLVEVTDSIARLVGQHKMGEGMVICYVPHTTAAVTINENADPDVRHDLLKKLGSLVPHRESYYQHSEGNSDSHVKTSLVGNSAIVLVEEGRLVLGRWQGIYFCEFDGPRQRELFVKLVQWA
jgi:secondary thiamine-phosphate synthase enzyme